jgi:hypothetical protein
MKEIMIVLALLLFCGAVAVAEEIEPSEDVLMRNTDGEIVPIFSIPAWESEVTFANPVDYENGTAVIGGADVKPDYPKFAGA